MAGPLKQILNGLIEGDEQRGHVFFSEPQFHQMLRIERKRTERSVVPFLLMLVNLGGLTDNERQENAEEIKSILEVSLRETDIKGWYEEGRIMGVIFTIINSVDERAKQRIFQKVSEAFHLSPNKKAFRKIKISFHAYPENLDKDTKCEGNIFDDNLYPDHSGKKITRKGALIAKRSIDIASSFIALVLLSPVLAAIAVAIKATSPGLVMFRQERLGFNGKRFMFLKFRSMYADNDPQPPRLRLQPDKRGQKRQRQWQQQ